MSPANASSGSEKGPTGNRPIILVTGSTGLIGSRVVAALAGNYRLICGDDDRLAGMITDRDITVRAVADGLDPGTAQAHEAMTPKVIYCYEDQEMVLVGLLARDP